MITMLDGLAGEECGGHADQLAIKSNTHNRPTSGWHETNVSNLLITAFILFIITATQCWQ